MDALAASLLTGRAGIIEYENMRSLKPYTNTQIKQ